MYFIIERKRKKERERIVTGKTKRREKNSDNKLMNFFVKLQKIQQKDKIFSQTYFQNILQYSLNIFRRKNNIKKCEFFS